ncbi:VOC family protein [Crenobacter sp. SG2303]|uniref:VOC family protein n=1 Tax=Crenobacter oryzisoli TaxID=3056844 RepID=A0ABT7XSA6_9NEIS|nr:VOC family protein [Crenobacter sp. SG2303]MDN0076600.1 VOC family protein [Crenobacter sp. SG2303]
MSYLKNLNYLILGSSRIDEWHSYFTDFLSMEVHEQADGSLKVRMDEQAYRFIVKPSETEDIWAAGFQVANRAELRAFEQHLRSRGIECVHGTADEVAERQVEDMFWFQDPEGLRLEAVCNPLRLSEPPALPHIPGGFLTGSQGFGHIAITAEDLDACEAFYKDVLDFKVSDYIRQDIQGFPIRFTFFHINPRHHTLALAGVPALYRMHHLMVEVKDVDVVGRALERAKNMDIPIHMEMGRHPNDRMLSFYAKTPSDSNVEFGTGGLEINDESHWEVKTYDAISEWGHKL